MSASPACPGAVRGRVVLLRPWRLQAGGVAQKDPSRFCLPNDTTYKGRGAGTHPSAGSRGGPFPHRRSEPDPSRGPRCLLPRRGSGRAGLGPQRAPPVPFSLPQTGAEAPGASPRRGSGLLSEEGRRDAACGRGVIWEKRTWPPAEFWMLNTLSFQLRHLQR